MNQNNMTKYIGTKVINAMPMDRATYNTLRGWDLPDDEDGSDLGYLVEYTDGGKSNHPDFEGYISWSPSDVFLKAYKPIDSLSFSEALEFVKAGHKVQRAGWNGKDMFIFLVPGSTFKVNRKPLLGIYENGHEVNYHAHIDMKTADGTIVPWIASQTDLLSNDWSLHE